LEGAFFSFVFLLVVLGRFTGLMGISFLDWLFLKWIFFPSLQHSEQSNKLP